MEVISFSDALRRTGVPTFSELSVELQYRDVTGYDKQVLVWDEEKQQAVIKTTAGSVVELAPIGRMVGRDKSTVKVRLTIRGFENEDIVLPAKTCFTLYTGLGTRDDEVYVTREVYYTFVARQLVNNHKEKGVFVTTIFYEKKGRETVWVGGAGSMLYVKRPVYVLRERYTFHCGLYPNNYPYQFSYKYGEVFNALGEAASEPFRSAVREAFRKIPFYGQGVIYVKDYDFDRRFLVPVEERGKEKRTTVEEDQREEQREPVEEDYPTIDGITVLGMREIFDEYHTPILRILVTSENLPVLDGKLDTLEQIAREWLDMEHEYDFSSYSVSWDKGLRSNEHYITIPHGTCDCDYSAGLLPISDAPPRLSDYTAPQDPL